MLKIRSGLKSRILNYFFLNESGEVYINELARIVGGEAKNVYRALVEFEGDGVLTSSFKGKQRYFSANKKHPLYKSYKEIFLKTAGLETVLKELLGKIKGLKEAYIFGSYANGKQGPASDIDVLLVGEHKAIDAQRVIYDLTKSSGREINAVHMTPEELARKKTSGDQFVESVFKRKVIRII